MDNEILQQPVLVAEFSAQEKNFISVYSIEQDNSELFPSWHSTRQQLLRLKNWEVQEEDIL
jgi:hypothetical protein